MKSFFGLILFLSLTVSAKTATPTPSPTPTTAFPTLTEVKAIPDRVKNAEAALCADSTASTKENCPDPKPKTGVASLVQTSRQLQVARELAFFEAYSTLVISSGEAPTLAVLEARLKSYEERMVSLQTTYDQQVKAGAAYDAFKLAFAPGETVKKLAALSSDQREVLKSEMQQQVNQKQSSITSALQTLSEYKKMITTAKESDWKKEVSAAILEIQKTMDQNKLDLKAAEAGLGCASVFNASKCGEHAVAAIRARMEQQMKSSDERIQYAKDQLARMAKRVADTKSAIATMKALAEKNPVVANPDADEDKLKQFELRFQSKIDAMANNKGYQDCGSSVAERLAIYYYSSNGYGAINKALRNGENLATFQPIIDEINFGLKKLKPFEGYVVRGSELPAAVKAQHTVGSVVTYASFTSTSLAGGFGGSSLFVIKSHTGRYIGSFSSHYSESEVLFASGTKFKVLDVKEEGGKTTYTMEEVVP